MAGEADRRSVEGLKVRGDVEGVVGVVGVDLRRDGNVLKCYSDSRKGMG